MLLSFIILTWNSENYICNCINALISELDNKPESYEIFIIDNGSEDMTVQKIDCLKKKYGDKIIPTYLKENAGTTYSRNLALRKAKGKYIFLIDSDVEVSSGTIDQLIETLGINKDVGLAVPKLVYPDGSLQKSTDVFPTVLTKIFRYFFLKLVEKKLNQNSHTEDILEVDYAISAVWAFKRELLAKVGYLDEKIFYAPEDVDYCLRIWSAGYKILFTPNAVAIHHTQEISRGLKLNFATFSHIKGLLYYFNKHRYFFRRPKFI